MFFSGGILGLNTFVEGILCDAESSLEKMPNGKRKNYITRNTWNQIEKRNQLRSNGAPSQEVHRLNKEISKQARLDRRSHLIDKFNENPNDPNKKGLWRAVKDLKRKFTPQYVHMKNLHGERVPVTERAQTIATYLETRHWKNDSETSVPDSSCIYEENSADESIFRLEELDTAFKVAKNNKQPGPDKLQMELLKWLDASNRARLLDLINNSWTERKAPQELFVARVVPIFKKGEADDAANYRPISLLSSVYKMYMMMIRPRMQKAVEDKVQKPNMVFSLANQPLTLFIYVIRRIQDYAESKGTRLSLALLDWEKAFDKIQHDKLILALQRMGFSSQFCDVIGDCYKEPTFVKDDFGCSGFKRQSAGIRQGCPLSPYFFAIVMSCIDFDIRARCSRWVSNGRIPGLEFDMVYFADDTILFSTDNRARNELLHLTEVISSKYVLCLNINKCVAIPVNNDGSVHFDNQEPLPKKIETTYLGNEINREAILARNFEQNARSKKDLVQINAILEGDECKFEMAIAV